MIGFMEFFYIEKTHPIHCLYLHIANTIKNIAGRNIRITTCFYGNFTFLSGKNTDKV